MLCVSLRVSVHIFAVFIIDQSTDYFLIIWSFTLSQKPKVIHAMCFLNTDENKKLIKNKIKINVQFKGRFEIQL